MYIYIYIYVYRYTKKSISVKKMLMKHHFVFHPYMFRVKPQNWVLLSYSMDKASISFWSVPALEK